MKSTPILASALLMFVFAGAHAEQADRTKPTQWEADHATHDDLKQVTILEGKVVVVRGTFVLRAQRVEMRQDPEGFQFGVATGTAAAPASFRQKRDGVEQFVEGTAERIDYDGKADHVTLTGKARLQRLEGALVADEVSGQVVVYDSREEKYSVAGGQEAASPTNPQGRVRGTIAPRATVAPANQTSPVPDDTGTPLRGVDSVGGAKLEN